MSPERIYSETLNVDAIRRTLDYIDENPEKWDQSLYGDATTETNCFFGLALRLYGFTNGEYYWLGLGIDEEEYQEPRNPSMYGGAQFLGLTEYQATQLSHTGPDGPGEPSAYRDYVSEVTGHDFSR